MCRCPSHAVQFVFFVTILRLVLLRALAKWRRICFNDQFQILKDLRANENLNKVKKSPILSFKKRFTISTLIMLIQKMLTEFVLLRFQQSGLRRFCSSARALASMVYILRSSFFIFFHLSPRITLMALSKQDRNLIYKSYYKLRKS